MADSQEFKCPCCGGSIMFDSTLQKLKCPYCDTEFETDALDEYNKEKDGTDNMNWDMHSAKTWDAQDSDMKLFVCKSCGGEVIVDENTVMVYINRLRQKIEDDPAKPKYIQTVRGLGYRFVV